ncbi:hypothetical protein ACLFMI_01415 [Pseudonocardia nantongensis]
MDAPDRARPGWQGARASWFLRVLALVWTAVRLNVLVGAWTIERR